MYVNQEIGVCRYKQRGYRAQQGLRLFHRIDPILSCHGIGGARWKTATGPCGHCLEARARIDKWRSHLVGLDPYFMATAWAGDACAMPGESAGGVRRIGEKASWLVTLGHCTDTMSRPQA
jgi:hypothetical protein